MAVEHLIIPPLSKQAILRFWEKVRIRRLDQCWPWSASFRNDYGGFGLGSRADHSLKQFHAHRVAWTIAYGPIPVGLCVLHHCDNPPCCNPRCLFLGTKKDNADDRDRKGRHNPTYGDAHGMRKHPELAARGEKVGSAKTTEEAVRAIRAEYATGSIKQGALGKKWGLAQPTIGHIVRRETWAHVL